MNRYTFHDPETQKAWENFNSVIYPQLKAIGDKVPKRANPNEQEIEELIRSLMEYSFQVARWLGNLEYFHETAYAETMMEVWEKDKKKQSTLIKAEVDGKIANVTAMLGKGKHTWKALELCLTGAQSLLRRMP